MSQKNKRPKMKEEHLPQLKTSVVKDVKGRNDRSLSFALCIGV